MYYRRLTTYDIPLKRKAGDASFLLSSVSLFLDSSCDDYSSPPVIFFILASRGVKCRILFFCVCTLVFFLFFLCFRDLVFCIYSTDRQPWRVQLLKDDTFDRP